MPEEENQYPEPPNPPAPPEPLFTQYDPKEADEV